jgi:hypothetical protein
VAHFQESLDIVFGQDRGDRLIQFPGPPHQNSDGP